MEWCQPLIHPPQPPIQTRFFGFFSLALSRLLVLTFAASSLLRSRFAAVEGFSPSPTYFNAKSGTQSACLIGMRLRKIVLFFSLLVLLLIGFCMIIRRKYRGMIGVVLDGFCMIIWRRRYGGMLIDSCLILSLWCSDG